MRIVLALVAALSLVSCDRPEVDPCQEASEISFRHEMWVRNASLRGASGDELTRFCEYLISRR